MFSMTKIKAVNGAGKAFYANHLAANDYYSEKEKVIGMWSGSFCCFSWISASEKSVADESRIFLTATGPRNLPGICCVTCGTFFAGETLSNP